MFSLFTDTWICWINMILLCFVNVHLWQKFKINILPQTTALACSLTSYDCNKKLLNWDGNKQPTFCIIIDVLDPISSMFLFLFNAKNNWTDHYPNCLFLAWKEIISYNYLQIKWTQELTFTKPGLATRIHLMTKTEIKNQNITQKARLRTG